jgi:YggT family protein
MSNLLCTALGIYQLVLLGYVILSWVPRPPAPLVPLANGIRALVDPVVRPIRGMLPPLRMGNVGLDLSILVVFFGVTILQFILGC